jgi:hypothetical protein
MMASSALRLRHVWAVAYRAFWDASFDRLDVYLQELHAQRRKEVRNARRRKR